MRGNEIVDAAEHYVREFGQGVPMKIAIAAGLTGAKLGLALTWITTPGVYQVACGLLVTDWLSGTAKANITHTVNSRAGFRGMVKTAIYLAILVMGKALAVAGPFGDELASWIAYWIIYNEAVSNLENAKAIAVFYGVDVPLLDRLISVLRMKADTHGAASPGGTAPLPPADGAAVPANTGKVE